MEPAAGAVCRRNSRALEVITADKNLVGANLELVDLPNREFRLRERIQPLRAEV